jgi:hypothetical protein
MLKILKASKPPRTGPTRPSILDPLSGDLWITPCVTDRYLVLYVQGQPVAILPALSFDLVSLNNRLFEFHCRRPREQSRP